VTQVWVTHCGEDTSSEAPEPFWAMGWKYVARYLGDVGETDRKLGLPEPLLAEESLASLGVLDTRRRDADVDFRSSDKRSG